MVMFCINKTAVIRQNSNYITIGLSADSSKPVTISRIISIAT